MRGAAERMLASSNDAVDDLFMAAQRGAGYRALVDEPRLAAAQWHMSKTYLLHWLSANIQAPGARVAPCTDGEVLQFARDLVRRGMDVDDLGSWRGAQHGAWAMWVDVCFAVTTDPGELLDLMKISERSMSTFIDDSIAALEDYVEAECSDIARGASAERHATVQLLLEGAPIPSERAESRLGYALTGSHVAAIAWVDSSDEAPNLDAAAEAIMRVCGSRRRLTLNASSTALWLWLPTATLPVVESIVAALTDHPGVRSAFGRPGRDLAGFRRSHLDAAAAQRVLARVGSLHRVVRYEDVALVSVLTADMALADQFVADTLGRLASAESVIRDTVLTYVREGFNGSAAADRLFTHRNTIERRLARADQLLPTPLSTNAASVVAALMLVQLRDTP